MIFLACNNDRTKNYSFSFIYIYQQHEIDFIIKHNEFLAEQTKKD